MPGPMKPDVRFVVRRLCVPVFATSVELATVGLPNGNQPCAVPSSKSVENVPVSAEATCWTSGSAVGALSVEHPTATTPSHSDTHRETTVSERTGFNMPLSPPIITPLTTWKRWGRQTTLAAAPTTLKRRPRQLIELFRHPSINTINPLYFRE